MRDEFVTDYDGDKVYMKSGKTIASNNVIWAAGVTGNVIEGLDEKINYDVAKNINDLNTLGIKL